MKKLYVFLKCLALFFACNTAFATVEISPITGGTIVPLTDGTTVSWSANQGYAYTVTIAGNRTMANPTSLTVGVTYILEVIQDATGSRTLTWGPAFRFPGRTFDPTSAISDAAVPPTLSTHPASRTLLAFFSDGTHMDLISTIKDIEGLVVPPSVLTATQNLADRVNLAWTDNSSDETGFEIWRANSDADIELLATVAAGVHVYADMAAIADPGRAYYVRAIRGADRSTFSNFAIGFTP